MIGKRNTKQKMIINSVIKEMKSHPTVSDLYEELCKRGYDIGKSTVYRVLSDATKEGQVDSIYSGDKNEHFDGNTCNHYHIRCTNCSRIFDSSLSYMPDLNKLGADADEDFLIYDHHMEFVGVCPKCKKKMDEENLNQIINEDINN